MAVIHIENMEFYAYHGHFKEEQIVGNKFLVDLMLEVDISKPAETDELEDALDYQQAYRIVKNEMEQNSKLLEHLAKRILDALYGQFESKIQQATIKISKLNPRVGGEIQKVSVILTK